MNENRSWRFNYQLPKPLPEGARPLTVEEVERELTEQLEASGGKSLGALWALAQFYNTTRRSERALHCLRQILALETELEAKAHCILALGQATEGLGDFPAAARFYREALAMEPVRNNVWYFIHNNLGYCLNQEAKHPEAEKFCRAAITINPDRYNAYKNLGIALEGQGQRREAAACFIRATQQNAGDSRATEHLRQLLENHPELKGEFSHDLELCCRSVGYVAAASARARQGIALQVLLGSNEPALTRQVISTLEVLHPGRRIETLIHAEWEGLFQKAAPEANDLIIVAPQQLSADCAGVNPLELARQALRTLAANTPAPMIVLLPSEHLAAWRPPFRELGADAVLGLPLAPNALAEAVKRLSFVLR
jgi:tetratricopeptide (TPR) repeat protein